MSPLIDMKDLDGLERRLRINGFPMDQWIHLGLMLGISKPKLDDIKDTYKSSYCLEKCLALWLQQGYDIEKYGKPTINSLVAAVIAMRQNAIASGMLLMCK